MPAERFRLRPQARRDLEAIFAYGALTWSVQQALAYQDELLTTVDRLCDFPGLGRALGFPRSDTRAFSKNLHVIVYHAEDDGVTVVRFMDQRSDWLTVLSEED